MSALQRQTPIGWPNRPRKVGEPDGFLLRVDQTIVPLVVSNQLETAHAVPRHRRGRGVRAGRLQRQSGSHSRRGQPLGSLPAPSFPTTMRMIQPNTRRRAASTPAVAVGVERARLRWPAKSIQTSANKRQ